MRERPWFRRAATATIFVLARGFSSAFAQELLPQPHSEFLLVDVYSVNDEVQLHAGPLDDPPYLYRGWTRAQMVDLSPSGEFSLLRIWDRSLVQGGRREAEIWQIELMPASPMALCVRHQGGEGDYDLSGMPLESLAAFGFSGKLRFNFGVPSPRRLETTWISLRDGSLELQRFLQAQPRTAVIRLSNSSARVDLGGRAFRGEADLIFSGPAGDIDLAVPRDVGLHVEGPVEVLRAFESEHMQVVGRALQSTQFEQSPCRLRLLFEPSVKDVDVRWIEAGAAPPTREEARNARPADPLERDFERQLKEFLVLAAKGEEEAAVRKLRDLRDLEPGDGRLLFLETWLHARPKPEFNVVPVLGESSQLFREGLDFFVAGRYGAALERFRSALAETPDLEAARAWIRKAQEELDREREASQVPPREPAEQRPVEPDVVERIVVQTAAPVFALRTPDQPSMSQRSGRVRISGQVGDDIGIDRIEVQVNGKPLLDEAGHLVTLLSPVSARDSAASLPFSVVVPLQRGRNEIVLTAYDRDATTHATRQRLVVVRQPPFWHTSAFVVLLAALGLVVTAVTLLWRLRRVVPPEPGSQ